MADFEPITHDFFHTLVIFMTKRDLDINAPYQTLNLLGKSIVYALLGQIGEQS